jgi:hypothetical protein
MVPPCWQEKHFEDISGQQTASHKVMLRKLLGANHHDISAQAVLSLTQAFS